MWKSERSKIKDRQQYLSDLQEGYETKEPPLYKFVCVVLVVFCVIAAFLFSPMK